MLCLIFLNTPFSKNTHSQIYKSLTEDLNFFFTTQELIVGCLFNFLKVYLLAHDKETWFTRVLSVLPCISGATKTAPAPARLVKLHTLIFHFAVCILHFSF